MKVTSAEAAKILRKLNEELMSFRTKDEKRREFRVSLGEDPESVRPEYDYNGYAAELSELEGKIRKIKHSINIFNTTHVVPGFSMTIDEMLVYIPQLTVKKQILGGMKDKLPKERVDSMLSRNSGIVEYVYTNYSSSDVQRDYDFCFPL